MESHLTSSALIFLYNDDELQKEILPFVGLKINGIKPAITRSSNALTTYKAVLIISKKMGVKPEEILEELP